MTNPSYNSSHSNVNVTVSLKPLQHFVYPSRLVLDPFVRRSSNGEKRITEFHFRPSHFASLCHHFCFWMKQTTISPDVMATKLSLISLFTLPQQYINNKRQALNYSNFFFLNHNWYHNSCTYFSRAAFLCLHISFTDNDIRVHKRKKYFRFAGDS